jgi:hypothetical protein
LAHKRERCKSSVLIQSNPLLKKKNKKRGAGLEKRRYWESDLAAVAFAFAGERGGTDIIDACFLSKACTLTLSLPDFFLFFLLGSSAHPCLLSTLVHLRIPIS